MRAGGIGIDPATFTALGPYLLAYQLLGSATAAEDIIPDAYLRHHPHGPRRGRRRPLLARR